MPWGYAAVAVAGLYSANQQSEAGKDAANAQSNAANYAADLSHQEHEQTRQDMMPWLTAGTNALGQQQNFLNGDYGAALNSPFYKASLEEGFKGLDMGATARGNLWGGGTDADRMRLGQNLASSQLQTYYNALAGLSGTGQSTANQLGQFGANYANQAGGYAQDAANARASSYANSANAWGNYSNQLAGMFGDYMQNRNQG